MKTDVEHESSSHSELKMRVEEICKKLKRRKGEGGNNK